MKLQNSDIGLIADLRSSGILWRYIAMAYNGNVYRLILAYNEKIKAG